MMMEACPWKVHGREGWWWAGLECQMSDLLAAIERRAVLVATDVPGLAEGLHPSGRGGM